MPSKFDDKTTWPAPDGTITHVKMCVRPGPVCLQGGCLYCPDGTWKTVRWLARYAWRNFMDQDFDYGYSHRWPNYPVKHGGAHG